MPFRRRGAARHRAVIAAIPRPARATRGRPLLQSHIDLVGAGPAATPAAHVLAVLPYRLAPPHVGGCPAGRRPRRRGGWRRVFEERRPDALKRADSPREKPWGGSTTPRTGGCSPPGTT